MFLWPSSNWRFDASNKPYLLHLASHTYLIAVVFSFEMLKATFLANVNLTMPSAWRSSPTLPTSLVVCPHTMVDEIFSGTNNSPLASSKHQNLSHQTCQFSPFHPQMSSLLPLKPSNYSNTNCWNSRSTNRLFAMDGWTEKRETSTHPFIMIQRWDHFKSGYWSHL